MSEQNILNADPSSEMSPDYGYDSADSSQTSTFRPLNDAPKSRLLAGHGRVFNLVWNKRLAATADALEQWERQYRSDFFTYYHVRKNRYFSGRFTGPLQQQDAGNDQINIKGQFEEMPNLPVYQPPANYARDGLAFGVSDGLANILWKTTGTWAYRVDNLNTKTPNKALVSSTIGDYAEFLYFGYGCQLWAPTSNDRGKCSVYLDNVLMDVKDQYTAGSMVSALMIDLVCSLGYHRVKVKVEAKNPASSANGVIVDTILVMQ